MKTEAPRIVSRVAAVAADAAVPRVLVSDRATASASAVSRSSSEASNASISRITPALSWRLASAVRRGSVR